MKTSLLRAGKFKLVLFLTLCAVVLGCAVFLCFNISNKHNTTTAQAATSVEMPYLTGKSTTGSSIMGTLSDNNRTLTIYAEADSSDKYNYVCLANNISYPHTGNNFTCSGDMAFGGYFMITSLGTHTCICTLNSGYVWSDGTTAPITLKVILIKYISPTFKYGSSDTTTFTYGSNSVTPTVEGNTGSGAQTWTSSNTNVATVSSTGVITPVGIGTATITLNVAAADGKYAAGKATKTITVKGNTANISFGEVGNQTYTGLPITP